MQDTLGSVPSIALQKKGKKGWMEERREGRREEGSICYGSIINYLNKYSYIILVIDR